MKFRLCGDGFWSCVLISIPLFIAGLILVIYTALFYNLDGILCSLFMTPFLIALLINIVKRIKDYFSFVIFTKTGISAMLFKRVWFNASWNEIAYIGEFKMGFMTIGVLNWMFFSKAPLILDKDILCKDGPSNTKARGNTVFVSITPKVRKEILKYISEDKIMLYGFYSRNGKKIS